MSVSILAPVVALVAWTLVMLAWLYATRIPATLRAKIVLDPHAPRGAQMAELPARVRWKADNYNHLMEQPTIFYAIALALALMGKGEGAATTWAWVYVGLRVGHSLIQATWNKIEVRFAVFIVSSVPLVALVYLAATGLSQGRS